MTERIRSWGRKSTSGYSDYGEVFKEFAQGPLQEISSKATVLILGDAKNNYRPAQEEYLKMIWEKVKRVIWLNPLDESQWQDRDNILRYYQPYCSQIVRCKNIDDLRKITRMII